MAEKFFQKAEERMEEKGTKGAFTRSAKKAGEGVQAYARKVLANPKASTKLKRRAAFAKAAGSVAHHGK